MSACQANAERLTGEVDLMTPEKAAAVGCREALRYALAELLRANLKLKDREARLKAVRALTRYTSNISIDRATDLRVKAWRK